MKEIVVKKIIVGVVTVLVIFLIIQGIILINIAKKINTSTHYHIKDLASLNTQYILELQDKIWPGVNYNPNKIDLFLYHKNGPMVNGPVHKHVYELMAYYWSMGLLSYSCDDERRYLSYACNIVLKDRIKIDMPSILEDEYSLLDITLKDKHVEEMYKDVVFGPSPSIFHKCSTPSDIQKISEGNKKTEEECYRECKKKHSKKECSAPYNWSEHQKELDLLQKRRVNQNRP